MRCDGQISVKLDPPKPDGKGGLIYNIPINCGKCLNCKRNRVNQWSHRLMKELEVSQSAHFVTLTYDTSTVPISEGGVMTLDKKDLQKFFKRLRYYLGQIKELSQEQWKSLQSYRVYLDKNKAIKYYAVGEYGTKRQRPHYHIILFNCVSAIAIQAAWENGAVHIDDVNNNTIDYTLKYMCKESKKWNWRDKERIGEFSLMSKGLGDNFLTSEMVRFYNDNLDVNYVQHPKGYKIPMPKYYRDKMLDKRKKNEQIGIIKRAVEKEEEKVTNKLLTAGINPEKHRILAVESRSIVLKRGQDRPFD